MPSRRCGYCYGRGHNRRGCPDLKREIKENPNGYYARKEKEKQQYKTPRKCSYCKTPGHTKRTCDAYKTDLADMISKIQVWRKKFINICKENGVGIGTLLSFKDPTEYQSEWVQQNVQNMISRHGKYGIVTGFNAVRLDHKQAYNAVACLQVRFPGGSERLMRLPGEFAPILEERRGSTLHVAAKINTDDIEDLFTPEWHEGTDTADWHLKNPHMIL